eukprot:4478_1
MNSRQEVFLGRAQQALLPTDQPYPEKSPATSEFIDTALVEGVWMEMQRAVKSKDTAGLQTFFHKILDVFVARFQQNNEVESEVIEALLVLFDCTQTTSKFYREHGLDDSKSRRGKENRPNLITDGQFATTRANPKKVSLYLLDNINHFGKRDGFEAILNLLKSFQTPCSPETLTSIIRIFWSIREYMPASWGKYVVAEIHRSVDARVGQFTNEDLKRFSKSSMLEMSTSLEDLAKTHVPKDVACYNKFIIDFSLKLLRSPFLEKRVHSLNLLNHAINDATQTSDSGRPKAGKLDPEFVVQWIVNNQIVQIALNQNFHPEVLKRLSHILDFLVTQKALINSDLELLWQSSQGKHESATTVFYRIVEDLACQLPREKILFLLHDQIAPSAKKKLDLPLLELMFKFVKAAGPRMQSGGWKSKQRPSPAAAPQTNGFPESASALSHMLEPLWAVVEDADMTEKLVEKASTFLCDLLKERAFQSDRILYLKRALVKITHAQSRVSVRMMFFMMQVLRLFGTETGYAKTSQKKQADERRETMIHELDLFCTDHGGLIGVIVDDLLTYLRSTEDESTETRDVVIGGRFEFIEFVSQNSKLHLSLELTHKLNAAFQNIPNDELFKFFTRSIGEASRHKYGVFAADVIQDLFDKELAVMQPKYMSLPAFECFMCAMLRVNRNENKLNSADAASLTETRDLDLCGLATLWAVALTNGHQRVHMSAAKWLVRFHTQLSSELSSEETLRTMRYNFIGRCMDFLSKFADQIQSKPSELGDFELVSVTRGLLLLELFINDGKRPSKSKGRDTQIPVKLMLKGSALVKEVLFDASETVGKLRQCASELFGIDIDQTELRCKMAVCNDDSALASKLKRIGGLKSILEISVAKVAAGSIKPKSNISAAALLSRDTASFKLLYSMLTLPSIQATHAWRLLASIPQNPELAGLLCSPKDPDLQHWQGFLNGRCALNLLYCLQIISARVLKNSKVRRAWLDMFRQSGGLRVILEVLKADLPTQEHRTAIMRHFRNKCVARMFEILALFVLDRGEFVSLAELSTDDLQRLPKRMLTSIREATVKFPPIRTVQSGITEEDIIAPARICIRIGFDILVALINFQNPLVRCISSDRSFNEVIARGLLENEFSEIRSEMSSGIIKLCNLPDLDGIQSQHHPRSFICENLLTILGKMQKDSIGAAEYFQLLQSLFSHLNGDDGIFLSSENRLAKLWNQVTSLICTHEVFETSVYDADTAIRGLLGLSSALVNLKPSFQDTQECRKLIQELFSGCLFGSVKEKGEMAIDPSKCKSFESRKAAFGLLNALVRNNASNVEQLFKLLGTLIQSGSTAHQMSWEIDPVHNMKASFVGLKNLGATCYMNSLMQQLYMTPGFARAMLKVEDPSKDLTNSLFYNVQKSFQFLDSSMEKYYNPISICKAFRDWSGNAIDVSQQTDVQEFFVQFFEHLEMILKRTPTPELLNKFFGGEMLEELICKGCPHKFSRKEPFFYVSLDIKGKRTIEQSLRAYVQGEMLQGDNAYMCGDCNRKVDTLKRSSIKTLPNTLILTLKRFEFDLDAMRKRKINDRCVFPEFLDMEPFTDAGLKKGGGEREDTSGDTPMQSQRSPRADSPTMYSLVGVLVHAGEADHGHYYSYIRDRKSQNWFEFNDTIVTPFDFSLMAKEAFGGKENINLDTGNRIGQQVVLDKNRSAYILFYQRTKANFPEDKSLIPAQQDYLADIRTNIAVQNHSLLREKRLFDVSLYEFMFDVVARQPLVVNCDYPTGGVILTSQAITAAIPFVFDVVCRQSDNADQLERWFKLLTARLEMSVPDCLWVLGRVSVSNSSRPHNWLGEFFLECPSVAVRKRFSALLLKVMLRVAPFELDGASSNDAPNCLKKRFIDSASEDSPISALDGISKSTQESLRICGITTIRDLVSTSPADQVRLTTKYSVSNEALCAAMTKAMQAVEYLRNTSKTPNGTSHQTPTANGHTPNGVTPKPKRTFSNFLSACANTTRAALSGRTRAADSLFVAMRSFAEKGAPHRVALIQHGLMEALVELVEMTDPGQSRDQRSSRSSRQPRAFDFTDALLLLEVLIRTCSIDTHGRSLSPLATCSADSLWRVDTKYFPEQFLRKLCLKHTKNVLPAGNIVAYLCWENENMSHTIIDCIGQNVSNLDFNEFYPSLRILEVLLSATDSLQRMRISEALGLLFAVIEQNSRFWKATDLCFHMILRIARSNQQVAAYLRQESQHVNFMEKWLNRHQKPKNDSGMLLFKDSYDRTSEGNQQFLKSKDDQIDLKRKPQDSLRMLKQLRVPR